MKDSIENPDFFHKDGIFKYSTIHNKKFDLYQVKYDDKLVFDNEFYPHNKSEFQYNTTIFHQKRFL